jgi:hypothetical protein
MRRELNYICQLKILSTRIIVLRKITTATNTRELTKAFELRPGGRVVAAAVLEVALDDLLLRQNLVREALPQGEQHGLAPGALALAIGAPADDAAGHCHPTWSLLFPTTALLLVSSLRG